MRAAPTSEPAREPVPPLAIVPTPPPVALEAEPTPEPVSIRRPPVPERVAIEESLGLRAEPAPPPPLELHPEDPRSWGGPASIPEVRDDYLKKIEELWVRRRELDPGNASQIDKLLDKIYEVKLENGQRNLFPLSAALVREARRLWTSADHDRASDLLSIAGRLSPDLPAPSFGMADLLWREGPRSFAPALEKVIEAVEISRRSFRERVRLATSLDLLLIITLLTLLMILPLMLLVRHRRAVFHAFDHLKPASISRPLALFLLALVFLLLAYLKIGPGWLILALLVLTWSPASRREKITVSMLWVLFALTPLMLGGLVNLLGALQRCAQDPLVRAQDEGFHPELRAALVRALSRNPDDVDLLTGLALVTKRGGHYEFAERVLLAALDRQPDSARLRNNLANVLYWEGREAEAEALLQRAIDLDPGLAAAHFNLSQILRQSFKLAEGEDEFVAARQLDLRLVQDQAFRSSHTPNRFLIDATLPDDVLRQRLFPSVVERNADVERLWSWIMRGLPWAAAGPVIGGLWIVFLVRALRPSTLPLFPRACKSCGAPVCARCGPIPKEEEECEGCLALGVGSPLLDPLFKRNKLREVRRARRIRRALSVVCSVLVPGAGQVLEGSPILGGVSMLVFFLLVFKLVFWNGIVNPSVVVFSGPSGPLLLVPAIAIGLLYVAVNLHLSYLRSKEEE